jgi:hypothetical protein
MEGVLLSVSYAQTPTPLCSLSRHMKLWKVTSERSSKVWWAVRPYASGLPFVSDTRGRAVTFPLPCWKCKYPGPVPTKAKWVCTECGITCFRDSAEWSNLFSRGYIPPEKLIYRAQIGFEKTKKLQWPVQWAALKQARLEAQQEAKRLAEEKATSNAKLNR